MDGSVHIENDALTITDLTITNEEIVDYFKDIPEEKRTSHLQAMILAGVTTFKTIGTTDKIDYIEKSFNKFHNNFDKKIEETLGEKGVFSDKIDETFGENGALVREVFNPNREGTPLYQLKAELKEMMKNIWETLEKEEGREEALAKTTFKGYDFEDVCEQILNDIVKHQQSDILEKTTENPGLLAPSKKGDFVITLGEQPDIKIVFETKDVGTMSIPEIHRQLEESIQNRGAQYGVMVFRFVESLPQSVGWFKEFYGNQLVIALGTQDHDEYLASELMHVAYIWAKSKLLQKEARGGTVNIIPIVQEKMKKITDTLKKFSTIRTNCTNLENTVGNIRGLIDTIEQEISDQLLDLEKEINKTIKEQGVE